MHYLIAEDSKMILVFLHGKGADFTAYHEQMKKLAVSLSADYISFNAPFKHQNKPNKFLWFNKVEQNNRKDAIKEEYLSSLNNIKEKLQQIPHPLSDIVLIGHSQGGGMAIAAGLELNLKCVFSLCGDLPYNIEYKNKSQTPIYWFEGQQDTYINQERKDSYKLLQKINADLHYQILKNCSHNEIDTAFLEIENIIHQKF